MTDADREVPRGDDASYESRIERLDAIVAELEGDGLPLDRALVLFEEGIELLRSASEELTAVEGKVALLIQRAEGIFEMRDFDA